MQGILSLSVWQAKRSSWIFVYRLLAYCRRTAEPSAMADGCTSWTEIE